METPHDVWTEWFTANSIIERLTYAFWSSPFSEIISAYAPVLGLLVAGMAIHWLPERWKQKYRMAFARAPMPVQVAATVATIALAYVGMTSGVQPFIYFQF
jgi:hypothetical protein